MRQFISSFCLTILLFTLTGCDPIAEKALFDFRQQVLSSAQKQLPSKTEIVFDTDFRQDPKECESLLLRLIPKQIKDEIAVKTNSSGEVTVYKKKIMKELINYQAAMTCSGKGITEDWASRANTKIKAIQSREDIYSKIKYTAISPTAHMLVVERKIKGDPVRQIFFWRWKKLGNFMYTCNVTLASKSYWHYTEALKTACILNKVVKK